MSTVTAQSESLRAAIAAIVVPSKRSWTATQRRIRDCSVPLPAATPRQTATLTCLVDLLPGGGNELLRVSGIAEELGQLLGTRVDVVAASLLRGEVSSSALADAVAV